MRLFSVKYIFISLIMAAVMLPGTVISSEGYNDGPPLTLSRTGPKARITLKSIHPPVPFLNEYGAKIIDAGGPLSLTVSCGACHDTDFISRKNYHSQVGLDEMYSSPGEGAISRAWDISPGMFGRWNPIISYRVLSSSMSKDLDMGTADWIMTMGALHVGGGPAETSRYSDEPLAGLKTSSNIYDDINPENNVIDPETGKQVLWDWEKSGAVELNCLICHLDEPDNSSRVDALKQGKFRWASTATLLGTDLVKLNNSGFAWNSSAFDSRGAPRAASFKISPARSDNCLACHDRSLNETTGEIFSSVQIYNSNMNIKGKEELSQAFDTHAERLLECTSCHYSMNNPVHDQKELAESKISHLTYDSRRTSINDYLKKPDHNLVKGHTAQGTVAERLKSSMRDCMDCHDAKVGHDFLPFKERHFEKLNCQTCHIPKVYSSARKVTDWTVLTKELAPVLEYRGVDGPVNDARTLITGFEPVLMMHEDKNGVSKIGPHNIIISWYWAAGELAVPVRLADLKKAYFQSKGNYHPDVIKALDADGNGQLAESELRLDTPHKVKVLKNRLEAVNIIDPRIKGELQPFSLSHGIASGKNALNDCKSCHSYDSRINARVTLADYARGNVIPEVVKGQEKTVKGEVVLDDDGKLTYRSGIDPEIVYIHGTDRLKWLDILGILAVLGVLFGVMGHGGLRIMTARMRKRNE